VKAHPLEIFLIILMASQLGGVSAMIVAVPAYTVLRIVLVETLPRNAVVARLTRDMRESWEQKQRKS
jgi:predicted PurR-regulated permease PerM